MSKPEKLQPEASVGERARKLAKEITEEIFWQRDNRAEKLVADLISREFEQDGRMREALEVLTEALKEPDGGSYWPARQYLDKYDKFHEDLDGTRVLLQVVIAALRGE